jgi:acetyltransferase-like isoleucine patch superfamily enzyme
MNEPKRNKVARKWLRTALHAALAPLPSALKVPIYRHAFGFRIGAGAHIGCSLLDVDHLELGDGARVGHGNVLTGTRSVRLGVGAEIGYGNILRGGDEIVLDRFATVLRFNVLNSIPDNDCEGPTDPRLHLGPGAYVVSGHRLDFTDRITLGTNVIVAGRNSSLWTHNRQSTRPIAIGDFCYLGSEVRIAPGASLGDWSILGMGAVLAGSAAAHTVHGGVPAKPIRAINDEDERVLAKKSKKEIPEDAY